jgi:hypothetical protein
MQSEADMSRLSLYLRLLLDSCSAKFPLWYAGVVYSAHQVAGGIGSMLMPYMIGPLANGVSFRAAISFCAVPFLILAGMALFFRRASAETHPRGNGRLRVERALYGLRDSVVGDAQQTRLRHESGGPRVE